ncbi:MAG: germination protein YpeB [Oscillospiraceae bacterium]
MKTKMSKTQLRIGLYMLSFIVVLGVFAYTGTAKAKHYELELRASEQRNLNALGEYVDELKLDLQKGVYSNTPPMMASLSTELWRDASGAKDCLAQLSTSDIALENTYKFLSQVGEFTMALNKKIADGQQIKQEERNQLLNLLNYATNLSKSISTLRVGIDNGTISTSELLAGNLDLNKNSKAASVSSSFSDIEQSLADYPTLIYDGPFSDHIMQKESKMVANKNGVTKEEALKIAAKFGNIDSKSLKISTEESLMKCFVFNSKDKTIAITKNGGFLCYMLGSQWAGETTLSTEDAIARAKEFLNFVGYKNMSSTYSTVMDGICTINFAYSVNNVICYTDLIKVSVSLSDGKIISVDARGFLVNHIQRTFGTPSLSLEQAKKSLSKSLSVQSVKLANIPTSAGDEKYCYEFKCKGLKDDDILVYIDTKTGDEVQILMLIYADGGTLTM